MSFTEEQMERLRRAFADSGWSGEHHPSSACPDSERIWAAATGQLETDQARNLLEHAQMCASCGAAWSLAAELLRAREHQRLSLAGAPARVRPGGRAVMTLLAAAAAMVVLSGIGLLVQLPAHRPGVEFRSEAAPSIQSLVDESVPMPRGRCRIRWTSAGEGARYTVLVASVGLETLHRSGPIRQTELIIPEQALAGVLRGASIVWTVEAALPDGTHITSPAFIARIE